MHTRPFATADSWGRIEYGLHWLSGNRLPYFSVTVSEGFYRGTVRRRRRGDFDFCGCCHELIATVAPDLAPLIALHLSGADGAPMHAEANGWYWLAGACGGFGQQYHGASGIGARSAEDCLQLFAEHARIPLDEARALAVRAREVFDTEGPKVARENFRLWCLLQAPRWKAEADAAIAKFNLEGWQS